MNKSKGSPAIDTKTLAQKTEEIKAHYEDIGMSDPSTRAKIQAMENAVEIENTTPEVTRRTSWAARPRR